MRATSIFSFELGTSTRGCLARAELRMRVSKSAIGSVVILYSSLPAGLHNAGDFALERQAAETDTAHLELRKNRARTAADAATIALADLVLQLLFGLRDLTGASHFSKLSLTLILGAERNAEQLQQLAAFFIVARRCGDGDVHALDLVHARVIDFRKHELILQADGVVAAPVKRAGRQTLEVADAGEK